MAWTTPHTWATGELVTAALLNSNVRDNMNYLFGLIPGTGAAATYGPLAPATLSNSAVQHMGMGSTFTVTPASTGRILLCVVANRITLGGSGSGYPAGQLRHGTGAAPANAAAATGTLDLDLGNRGTNGVTWLYRLTGLALGTAIWFDLAFSVPVTGTNTVAIDGVVAAALEL